LIQYIYIIQMSQRDIWEFTIGVDKKRNMNIDEDNFKYAMTELTEELTKLSGGLTYYFCCGTWEKNKINGKIDKNDDFYDEEIVNTIERTMSCCITIIVYPNDSKTLYNCVKHNVSDIKKNII